MFSVAYRKRVCARVLEWAACDERVVAGAAVGSLALGEGDRWADLDLTFGVSDDVTRAEVLVEWTEKLKAAFEAVHLFDVPQWQLNLSRVLAARLPSA